MAESGWSAFVTAFGSISVLAFIFLWMRGKAYLLFFQQEEYDSHRFLRWIVAERAIDKEATAVVLVAIAAFFLVQPSSAPNAWTHYFFGSWYVYIAATLWGAFRSWQSLRRPKKPLVMTARASRILAVYLLASIGALFGLSWVAGTLATQFEPSYTLNGFHLIIILQLPPFLLVLANWLLGPFEKSVRRKYRMAAVARLRALRPMVIGITGSYGKTSTKHFLAHILSSAEPTLTTPGSVNTEMGIVRVIRQHLEPRDKYFIVEMGAYGIGSIARLCALTPPRLGIITGVGMAHYERFQSLENVMVAKFELAQAVHASGGKTIVNVGAIPGDLMALRRTAPEDLLLCGRAGEEDGDRAAVPGPRIALTSAEETRSGLEMTLVIEGEEIALTAPVWGVHQAENIMLAAAAARELGFPMETIRASLRTLKQVRHRLEVTRSKTGPWVIDDAYNSNPVGFAAALQTLNTLSRDGGRRVLITPGMVELGAEHAKQHRELGWEAGRVADLALVVTPDRIPTFIAGFEESMPEWAELRTFATQQQAEDWYKANANPRDVVLFENNLPDLFEAQVRF